MKKVFIIGFLGGIFAILVYNAYLTVSCATTTMNDIRNGMRHQEGYGYVDAIKQCSGLFF